MNSARYQLIRRLQKEIAKKESALKDLRGYLKAHEWDIAVGMDGRDSLREVYKYYIGEDPKA